ncbi:MAG: hypothetical protein WD669_12000 [Pirellulales bacterium]
MVASIVLAAPGEVAPQRPDLTSAKPLVAAKLRPAAAAPQPAPQMRLQVLQAAPQPAAVDALVNYMRSARGEWRIAANVDRDDPWNRLLLLGPKQPVLIDIAVFIDGKPYRSAREVWIDDVLAARKSADNSDQNPSPEAKEQETTAEPKDEAGGVKQETPAAEKKSGDAAGTPPAEESSKQNPTKDAADKGDEKPAAAEMAVVDPKSRQAPAIRERLMNYLATIGPSVSRDEIRWLLAEWGSGPPLIVLGPGLSWQRSGAIPLLTYLDRDGDGAFSNAEIGGLPEQLQKADRDADDVIDVAEIRRATDRPPTIAFATDHPLLVTLDEDTNWQSLASDIQRIYGKGAAGAMPAAAPATDSLKERIRRPAGPLGGDELRRLLDEPADVTLRVDFSTAEGQATGVSVLSVGPELGRVKDAVTATEDVVTLDLGADYIEISAAGAAGGKEDIGASQVAIGAVVDGDPLLRMIDRDQDGRLTSRERQALADLVRGLDRDGDGQATAIEIPVPIRLAVTLGPQAHAQLDRQTLAARVVSPKAAPTAPDWFAAADLNRDGDLTRSEFIGTPDDFQRLDTDSDGRLSITEALAAGGGE